MLRIGIDARELLGETTGVGRYLGELLRRWTVRPDASRRRFVLYAPEALGLPLPDETVEHRTVGSGRGTWWEQTALGRAARRDGLDVFFAPAYTAPLGLPVPVAVTIHDVSFLAHPEWFRPRERLRRRLLTTRAARSAAVVLTVSQFSRREIERHTGVPPERIRVIPQGVSAPPAPLPASPREPLILYVGSVFNRRRVPDLIAAFALVAAGLPEARLVIVGDNRTWPRQDLEGVVAAHRMQAQVELRSYVDEATLAALYGRASGFAFLSEYEGFGLTPLEALQAGVPIVVLDTAVAREVYGPAAVYVEPGDIDGTARALHGLLTGSRTAAMRDAAAVLARYSWDRTAADTLTEIERVAAR